MSALQSAVSSLGMERTILTGALLLDGTGAPPVTGRAVVVEHGRISAVVSTSEAPSGTSRLTDPPVTSSSTCTSG